MLEIKNIKIKNATSILSYEIERLGREFTMFIYLKSGQTLSVSGTQEELDAISDDIVKGWISELA